MDRMDIDPLILRILIQPANPDLKSCSSFHPENPDPFFTHA
jgi:hypothetical protein